MKLTGVTIGLYMVINILGPLDASGGVLRKNKEPYTWTKQIVELYNHTQGLLCSSALDNT